MTEQDYVAFCNFAYGLRKSAEAFCAALADEEARQLEGLVRMELTAMPAGKIEPAYDFLAAVLAEEIEQRDNSEYQMAAPKGDNNDLPF